MSLPIRAEISRRVPAPITGAPTRWLGRDDERGGDCGDPLTATGEAESVAGGRREADRHAAEGCCECLLALSAPGRDAGTVTDDLDCHVPDQIASGSCQPRGLGQ